MLTWFAQRQMVDALQRWLLCFVVSRCIKGIILGLPLENSSDASIHLKHKWVMMWCSAVVQSTPVQIYGVRQGDEMFVGMLLLYSRHVIVNGEPVSCKPPQKVVGLQQKKKKNINYPVKIYKYVRSKCLMGKNCCNIFVSLQLDESIWSIDVNKLELICFKYPLKVNWHCWNKCICVYGTMGSNVVFFVQIKNVASFEIIQRYENNETSKLV